MHPLRAGTASQQSGPREEDAPSPDIIIWHRKSAEQYAPIYNREAEHNGYKQVRPGTFVLLL